MWGGLSDMPMRKGVTVVWVDRTPGKHECHFGTCSGGSRTDHARTAVLGCGRRVVVASCGLSLRAA